jgi:hypothetical protein
VSVPDDRSGGTPGDPLSWIRRIGVVCFVIVIYAVFFYCFYAIFAQGFSPGFG